MNALEATKDKIVAALKAEIEQDKKYYDLHQKCADVFKAFEGKQITKRMESALKKAYPEWTIYYSAEYGMYHIKVWGLACGRPSYDNAQHMLLGYESDPVYTAENFEKFDCCHGSAAIERNQKRDKFLASPELEGVAQAIMDFKRAEEALKNTMEAVNEYTTASAYAIEKAFGIKI
jgi:hypothetical protein